jgi:hypothetical protein
MSFPEIAELILWKEETEIWKLLFSLKQMEEVRKYRSIDVLSYFLWELEAFY